jgi:hypothetical protein
MLRWTQILVVSVLGTSLALANISTNVPLYHWSYDAVDRLVQSGLIDSDMPGTRP